MARIRSIKPEFWITGVQRVWPHGSYLYLVQQGRKALVKVGIAAHPGRRLSSLQSGNAQRLFLRGVFSGDRSDCLEVERQTLREFRHQARCGEWLAAPCADVLEFIGTFTRE